MIAVRSITAGSLLLMEEMKSALGLEVLHDFAWPLPNAEAVSAPVYWQRFMAGDATALIEVGVSKVGERACRVYATYERDGRDHGGGVAVAIDIRSLEPSFFTWSTCRHQYDASHDGDGSTYVCRCCKHVYRIEVES